MDYQSILAGSTLPRGFKLVKRADGAPITSGTVNYYLYSVTGTNAGKWWAIATNTWEATAQANAMTHVADGSWSVALDTTPWVDGVAYLEYAKESGDLHIPVDRWLVGRAETLTGYSLTAAYDAAKTAAAAGAAMTLTAAYDAVKTAAQAGEAAAAIATPAATIAKLETMIEQVP